MTEPKGVPDRMDLCGVILPSSSILSAVRCTTAANTMHASALADNAKRVGKFVHAPSNSKADVINVNPPTTSAGLNRPERAAGLEPPA